ncbi:MAG: hypothetical protein U9R79_15470 [Armatimonadota bacterium]|nr:hypothetical protein [Armatimonadota bacterium]
MRISYAHALVCAVGLQALCGRLSAQPATIRPYLAEQGVEVDASGVLLRRDDGQVVATFRAPRDGVYSVGVALEGESVTPLAPGLTECRAEDLAEPLVLRYPYDWTYHEKRNVLNLPRLAAPGLLIGEWGVAADTHDLWSLRLEGTDDGRVRAILLAHRYRNDGGDAATADLHLAAGEEVTLRIRTAEGQDASWALTRSGERRPIDGLMMQVAYRGWTAIHYEPEHYRRIAEACEGVYDWIIVRENATRDWIPPILHQRGIRALAYQYIGALRRYSPQVTEALEAELGMQGAGGQLYTGPYSPDGPWLLADIRRPQVRELFVARAAEAVEAGFDGIFLDGSIFWPDATGRRGGIVPGAEHSLAWAHWELLSEIVGAVHEADEDAVVGVLGNDYYDALSAADFVLKERMYFAWDQFARELPDRRTKVRQDLDVGFERGEAPLVPTRLAYGVKGYSSISVRTARHFVREPTGLWYLGTGDHTPELLDEWLDAIVAHATEGLHVTEIDPPDCWLHFGGRDTIWADRACRIELSGPACLADENGTCQGLHGTPLALEAERRYRLLQQCPGGDQQ